MVKAIVFLRDMDHYDQVHTVYSEYMSPPYPAPSAVKIVNLPVDINVEIEVVAGE